MAPFVVGGVLLSFFFCFTVEHDTSGGDGTFVAQTAGIPSAFFIFTLCVAC